MCGENPTVQAGKIVTAGSSPRVRGKPLRVRRTVAPVGLIPACAGKTPRPSTPCWNQRAHPRVCGENVEAGEEGEGDDGSSPRVRGKQPGHRRGYLSFGLIPACAGKTRAADPSGSSRGAHPRVCGENDVDEDGALVRAGSSPRVRGKPPVDGLGVGDARLIPACAGKTDQPLTTNFERQAHPRVCGENTS